MAKAHTVHNHTKMRELIKEQTYQGQSLMHWELKLPKSQIDLTNKEVKQCCLIFSTICHVICLLHLYNKFTRESFECLKGTKFQFFDLPLS